MSKIVLDDKMSLKNDKGLLRFYCSCCNVFISIKKCPNFALDNLPEKYWDKYYFITNEKRMG